MLNYRRARLLLLLALLGTRATAGDGPGFYAGGGVGLSHYEDEEEDIRDIFASGGLTADVETDNTDLGWKIFGGYRFTQYLGAEIGYIDLGEETADVSVLGLNVDATSSVSGVSIAGTVGYPVLPQAYVFGKLGGFVWDSSVGVEGAAALVAASNVLGAAGEGENGVDVTFGIGGTYELVEHVKVRAEWERFQGLGDDDIDIDLFSGGIQYDF